MDDFERRVLAEIGRLEGSEFPGGRRAQQQRVATIRALAEATVAGEPWTGPDGVLGPRRPAPIVSEPNFYSKKHWYAHPLTREVLDNVIRLYRERDAAEREQARLEKVAWLTNKEFEAAEKQFDKAHDLLGLPHLVKKTKRTKPGKDGEAVEEIVILDPANAAVFSSAVRLNESASKLARRSLGLPLDVQRSEVTGADGGPLTTQEVGRVHGGAEHLAAVARILVEAGAVELRPVEPGDDAADDEVHSP